MLRATWTGREHLGTKMAWKVLLFSIPRESSASSSSSSAAKRFLWLSVDALRWKASRTPMCLMLAERSGQRSVGWPTVSLPSRQQALTHQPKCQQCHIQNSRHSQPAHRSHRSNLPRGAPFLCRPCQNLFVPCCIIWIHLSSRHRGDHSGHPRRNTHIDDGTHCDDGHRRHLLCQCPVVRHTSTHEFQSLHLSQECLRDKLVKSHPMLPLRERPAEAFQLSPEPPPEIQLDN